MRVFNGLAREMMQRQRAQAFSPTSRPVHIKQDPNGRFMSLITCPKCGNKGLPMANCTDITWTAQCVKCAAVFAFHDRATTPGEAVKKARGIRDRAPGVVERSHGKTRYLDADRFAEQDLEARSMGARRAHRVGL